MDWTRDRQEERKEGEPVDREEYMTRQTGAAMQVLDRPERGRGGRGREEPTEGGSEAERVISSELCSSGA